jgi:hypothetical protein
MSKEKSSVFETPSYAYYSESEQEAFLSQLGTFTPAQRTLFHALCEFGKGEVPYKPFAERMSLQVRNVHSELEELVRKLSHHKIALFYFSYDGETRRKQSIILTEQGSECFYRYALININHDIGSRGAPTMPFESTIEQEGLALPEHSFSTVEKEVFSKSYIEKTFKTPKIIAYILSGGEKVFFLSDRLNAFIQLCIEVVRDGTDYGDILSDLARFKNTSLTSFKASLATRAPLTWLDIARTILEYRKSITSQKEAKIRKGWFQAAEILYNYLNNEVEDARKRKKEEQEIETDLKAVHMQLKNKYRTPITQEQMNALLAKLKEKYGAEFPDIKNRFFDEYTKFKEKTQLPPVLFLTEHYIHRDHLFRYAAFRFEEISEELEKEYIQMMAGILKTNNRENNLTFHTVMNFEEDIERNIRQRDKLIAELLERPRIFAESIIHTAKREYKISDIEQVRPVLEQYFQPETMQFRLYAEVLHLNIFNIFKQAFLSLSVMRQFWMKLTGKFRAHNDTYEKYRPKIGEGKRAYVPGEPMRFPEPSHQREGVRKDRTVDGRPVNKSAQSADGPRSGGGGNLKTYKRPGKGKKPYTIKQAEEAWETFRSTLKK